MRLLTNKINQKTMKVKFKRLHKDAVIPSKKIEDDFCFDLTAVTEEEIAPNVWRYGFGFALQIVNNMRIEPIKEYCSLCFSIRPRSSVWKTGMILSDCIGTIDEGYTGEISAVFYHVMPNMERYHVGDRIAQLHFDQTTKFLDFIEVNKLDETERGDGGYGSTGK